MSLRIFMKSITFMGLLLFIVVLLKDLVLSSLITNYLKQGEFRWSKITSEAFEEAKEKDDAPVI